MNQRVIVVGAGIGGLSAAHELVKRGFKVSVYERRAEVGGKATSTRTPSAALSGDRLRRTLPREHGFRFFPGWYRHLLATMREIPIQAQAQSFPEVNVASNLIPTDASRMVWSDRPPVTVPMHLPRNWQQAKNFAGFASGMLDLGIANGEIAFFFSRIAAFMSTPEEVRVVELQKITWWDYLEADKKSDAYKDLITATTRTLIAANAKEASAYTLGRLAIRTLSDTLGGIDHVLNGPTSETWLSSWQHHLEQSGVQFFFGKELESIDFATGDRTVHNIQVSSVAAGLVRKLRGLLRAIAYDAAYERQGKERFRDNAEAAGRLITEIKTTSNNAGLQKTLDTVSAMLKYTTEKPDGTSTDFRKSLPASDTVTRHGRPEHWRRGGKANAELKASKRDPLFAFLPSVKDGPIQFSAMCTLVMDQLWDFEESKPNETVKGDQFVFALPVEQMAYYVNRSSTMTTLDPDLANIVTLANHTDWMAGIQFYLNDTVDLGKGHFILMDSAWSLTAIEERQFWSPANTNNLSPLIQSVVSIDIASWGVPGRFTRKKAYDCSDEEIATEVWSELKAAVNRREQKEVLHDGLLLSRHVLPQPGSEKGKLEANINFCVDENIVDLFDRKKQAAYEKARNVQFSVLDTVGQPKTPMPFVSGPRLRFNTEPLLINRVGTLSLRPSAKTAIPNMFLAADYVKTETDLACMEGANEAARRAVNAMLDAVGSNAARCEIWPFSVPQNLATQLLNMVRLSSVPGVALAGASLGKAADSAGDIAARAAGVFRGFWKRG